MLTAVTVKALQPKAHKYDHMDLDNPGFGVHVMPSGSKSFMFRYRVGGRDGKQRRMILGPADTLSLKEALTLYQDARKLLELGTDHLDAREDAALQAEQDMSFAALAEKYLAESAHALRWVREERRIFNHDILPAWGKRKAKDIKKRDVIALLDKILDRGAATQANRTFGRIRRLFNWAVQ